ncbi:hypothetical protein [Pseudomonas sp. UMAB-40]|uniref:hypothetical protein n=1 Tax=Pseudomonas sp. UMAB-40 TaxID=1365407 RepID=UPI001C593259|nr:hypothetical protein [Pseudomonas sp. UMAB-40]
MSATNGPVRHDIMFSMSDASKERVDLLLRQCGHASLNLLLARGLALVQWVEDQQDQGRTVGAVIYGAEGGEDEVFELEERPELLKPQPRPQSLPTQVKAAAPVVEPTPAPKPEPVASTAPVIDPAKLVARPKTPPPVTQPRYRAPSGREQQLRAHIPNDNGPVKTHTWVRWRCKMDKRLPPILIGDDRALPGELTLEHLPELERMLVDARHATHFQLTKDNYLAYYGFQAGKGKRGGWCYVEEGSMQLRKDDHCDGGLFAIFPVVMAVEYLRRLANPRAAVASA